MSFGVFNVVERVERRNSSNVNKALISVLQSLKVRPAIFISWLRLISLFARLISHQPAVLFSQNEPATSNQPQPASSTLLSEQTSTSHQPPANRTGWILQDCLTPKLLGQLFVSFVDEHISLTKLRIFSREFL
jgi:hypothetical protein